MKEKLLNQKTGMINDDLRTITSKRIMRGKPRVNKIYLVVIGILGLLMSSCLVKSLHPFYNESDVVFRKDILGTYVDQKYGIWTIESEGDKLNKSKYYLLKLVDKNKKKVTLRGCLFKLDNDYYVDFYLESGNNPHAETDLSVLHVLGVHTVAKVIIGKNSLQIKWYNVVWLDELFKQNKIRLAHEKLETGAGLFPDDIVLTASTNELQKFMKKFANDPKAFDEKVKGDFEYVLNRIEYVLNRKQ